MHLYMKITLLGEICKCSFRPLVYTPCSACYLAYASSNSGTERTYLFASLFPSSCCLVGPVAASGPSFSTLLVPGLSDGIWTFIHLRVDPAIYTLLYIGKSNFKGTTIRWWERLPSSHVPNSVLVCLWPLAHAWFSTVIYSCLPEIMTFYRFSLAGALAQLQLF